MVFVRRILGGLCLVAAAVCWAERDRQSAPSELRIVTYNILADDDRAAQRVPRLLAILKDANADIIVLQEVTPWFGARLLKESWVQDYHRPLQDGKTLIAHEFLILARFPIAAFETAPLPGKQHRAFFSVTIRTPGGTVRVATCHLESLLEDGPTRAEQLDVYFQRLGGDDDVFLAGDFNFGDGEQPDTAHIGKSFHDAWREVFPNKPGFTWDIKQSLMAKEGSFPHEPSRRLDRVLYRSATWSPVAVELLGTEPVSAKNRRIFPSDHFGLLAVFRAKEGAAPAVR